MPDMRPWYKKAWRICLATMVLLILGLTILLIYVAEFIVFIIEWIKE